MTLPPFVEEDPLAIALDPANVLPRRIHRWAVEQPHRPFLVEAATGRTASYGETWAEIGRWARVLADAGVGRGSRVATLLPSSIDAHVVWLAASALGAYEVPVNPELRGEFLAHVLTDAAITVCVTRPRFAPLVATSGVDGITVIEAPADRPVTAGVEPLELDALPGPDDVSCVIYTSGTTGPSKGVVIAWAQMSAIVGRLPREWLSADDAIYSPWPMFHVTGRSPMMAMADVGGRVVLREGFSRPDFWSDIRTNGCTSTTIGAVTGLLLAAPERDDDRDHPMRFVLFGKVGDEGRRLLDRFGVDGVCFYGSTEVGFPVGQRPVAAGDEHLAGGLRRGYEGRVVDETGDDAPDGIVGELWIRPPDRRLILVEYLGQPELTARAVVDGWYRTGDAVRRHTGGAFEFVDRLRDTIRRFGENISSAALESAVLAEPDVLECAAIGVPSSVTGHDVLVAVVAQDGAVVDPADLAGRLRDRLPRYMSPSYVVIVDALPHTPNGKIRKVGLLDTLDLTAANVWRQGLAASERLVPGTKRSATTTRMQDERDTVTYEVGDGIAWVWFNRPDKRNAMSRQLNRRMLAVLDELEFRDDVGVLVLGGKGEAWSAGMDLQEYFREPEAEGFEAIRRSQLESYGWFTRLRNFEKVTIAMVHGWCFGGAYAPLYACDLAFCADDAVFGLSEVNWGILPGGGASKVAVDLMPMRDAMYHALMGENLTGQQAAATRLVNESLPADQLEPRVREVATKLLAKNWATLKATKRTIRAVRLQEYDVALDYQVRAQEALMYVDATRGRQEAMRQFLDEKSFKPGLGTYQKD